MLIMSVSAIVVTFNRLDLLKENLYCLLKQKFALDKIFVINNKSSDGTMEYLDGIDNSKIIVKNLSKNLGGAGGFNYGLKFAYKNSNSDYFWLMDDDTMPTVDSLDRLITSSNKLNGNFGFLSSNVKWWKDNSPCNVPGDLYHNWTELAEYSMIRLTNATFVSVLIPRKALMSVGFPIKDFFIWGDDIEFTHRLSEYAPSYMVTDSIVVHKSKNNGSSETIYNCNSINRIIFSKYWYRNLLYIDRKYFSNKRFIKEFLSLIVAWILIPFKSRNHRILRMINMGKGIFNGILFNPKIDKN